MMKKKRFTEKKPRPGFGWAYVVQDHKGNWVLCDWVNPTRTHNKRKPSTEAKLVRVKITRAAVGER